MQAIKPILPSYLGLLAYNGKYEMPMHLKYLERKLMQLHKQDGKRVIISMPPRHGKSEYYSRLFNSHYIMAHPDKRVILASYEAQFAASWGRKCRELVSEYGGLYDIKINPSSNASDRFDIDGRLGGMNTAGAGGAITGKGAHLFGIDDPVKNDEQAMSKVYRDKVWEWYRATAYTRLEPGGSIVIIMTRWHYDDLVGRILQESKENWEVIEFPAIATDYDILGRKPGEALWKERYPIERLEAIREEIGSFWFSALYQQQPIPSEHQIFKTEWWQYYDTPPESGLTVQAWDTAFKTKEENDYSSCGTWRLGNNGYYLIDHWRGKVEFPELLSVANNLYEKHKPGAVLIEDAASGQSLIQSLKRDTKFVIHAMKADKDKVTKAHLVTPLFESGKVFIPKNAEWLHDYLSEFNQFPNGKNDDQVDDTYLALTYLKARFGGSAGYKKREKTRRSRLGYSDFFN